LREGREITAASAGPGTSLPKSFDENSDGPDATGDKEKEVEFCERGKRARFVDIPLHVRNFLHRASLIGHREAVCGAW
jgi:hypothetical protein